MRRNGRYSRWGYCSMWSMGLLIRASLGLQNSETSYKGCFREGGKRNDCSMRNQRIGELCEKDGGLIAMIDTNFEQQPKYLN